MAADATAKAFDAVLHHHWLNNEEAFSNSAVARQAGVDEKHVRQWRSGEKRIPLAALVVMPATVTAEMSTWALSQRGIGLQQRSVTKLSEALDQLERPISAEDRDEVLRSLLDAQRRITERVARLVTEGSR